MQEICFTMEIGKMEYLMARERKFYRWI